jgi:hypothetical protein
MIVLAVMTYNGAAAEPIEASFDELGGTIGRADGNLMVLPDPERTISSVHAKVVHRNGSYAIEDRGSNPILVNGNVVGHGKEWPLAPGDVVQIGGYELGVRASGSPAASLDPFADVFGTEPMCLVTAPDAFCRRPVPRRRPRRRRSIAAPLRAATPSRPRRRQRRAAGHSQRLGPAGARHLDQSPVGLGLRRARPRRTCSAPRRPRSRSTTCSAWATRRPEPGAAAWPEDDDFLGIFDAAGPASGGVGEPVAQAAARRRPHRPRPRRTRRCLSPCGAPAGRRRRRRHARTAVPAPPPVPPPVPPRLLPQSAREPRRGGGVLGRRRRSPGHRRRAGSAAARRNGVMATHNGGTRPGRARRPRRPCRRPRPLARDDLLRALLEGLGTVEARRRSPA